MSHVTPWWSCRGDVVATLSFSDFIDLVLPNPQEGFCSGFDGPVDRTVGDFFKSADESLWE
jgi:hypothetical protein